MPGFRDRYGYELTTSSATAAGSYVEAIDCGLGALEGFEEKLALDFYYMKYRSMAMDLLILWKTAKTVVLFHGV